MQPTIRPARRRLVSRAGAGAAHWHAGSLPASVHMYERGSESHSTWQVFSSWQAGPRAQPELRKRTISLIDASGHWPRLWHRGHDWAHWPGRAPVAQLSGTVTPPCPVLSVLNLSPYFFLKNDSGPFQTRNISMAERVSGLIRSDCVGATALAIFAGAMRLPGDFCGSLGPPQSKCRHLVCMKRSRNGTELCIRHGMPSCE